MVKFLILKTVAKLSVSDVHASLQLFQRLEELNIKPNFTLATSAFPTSQNRQYLDLYVNLLLY